MSSTPTTITNCQARAYAFLADLIGARPETLIWDSTHRLQGHVRVGCHDVVIIATRDPSREPVVLTSPSWDAVRRSSDNERRDLVERWSIKNHSGLASAIEMDVRLAA